MRVAKDLQPWHRFARLSVRRHSQGEQAEEFHLWSDALDSGQIKVGRGTESTQGTVEVLAILQHGKTALWEDSAHEPR